MILNTNVVFLQKVGIQLVRQSLDQAQLGWIETQTEYENAISNQKFGLEIALLQSWSLTRELWVRADLYKIDLAIMNLTF